MNPSLQRALALATDHGRRLAILAREQGQRLLVLAKRYPGRTALIPPALLLAYLLILIPLTPSISDIRKARVEEPSRLMSADGLVLAEYKRVNRQWVPLDQVAMPVIEALIATEDRRFADHMGIDFRRTAGAAINTLRGKREGGSTITQQLARNLYPEEIGRAPTLNRKAKEAITALKIEAVYSKKEILETYLNTVPFLYNAFGIEMAARTYFDKPASKLDVLESATLIGMLKGTSYYNPVLAPERAKERRNIVLAQMVAHGKLDAERARLLAARPLRLDFERQEIPLGMAPHLAQHLRKWLIAWADSRDYDIHADGLVVRTTIDTRVQQAANKAVARQLQQLQPMADRMRQKGQSPQPLTAGFLAIDPRNGTVKAWVGSRDFAQEQFDHVNQARRQPGSTFKPFVYGAAFAQGLSPDTTFVDEPVQIRGPDGGAPWSPRDGTPATGLPMTLREGLAQSRNSITAQVMQRVGPASVAELARALGVRDSKLDLVPSLALGTSPVTLREMVTAYGSIANGGRYIEPSLVLQVEDREGKVLQTFAAKPAEQAMPRVKALELANVMRGVIDEGTGAAIRGRWGIQADVAGKTGTTQDNTDGWFIMMHPELVAGAWVGFNDSQITMADSWGQGARSALPMVGEVFQQALKAKVIDPRAEFPIPRPRPKPKAPPPSERDPVQDVVNEVLNRLWRMVQ